MRQRHPPLDTLSGQPSAIWAVGAITLLAAILRLLYLGKRSLWLDEVMSVSIARLDPPGFRNIVLSWEANMALYWVMLRAWLHLGQSEFTIRLLSAIAAIATVPLIFALARRSFGERVGLLASLLMAGNVFHVRYAQEARSYSLYLLLVVLTCWLFVKSVDKPSPGHWVAFAVTATLAVYAHFFAALILPVVWLAAIAAPKPTFPWRGLVRSTVAICIALLPVALFILTKDKGQRFWVTRTTFREVYDFAVLLSGRGGLLLLLLDSAALLAAAFATVRSWRDPEKRWTYVLMWSWLLLPVVLTIGLSLVKPMFVSRYLILCLPPFLILVAMGLSQLRRRWLFTAATLVVFALSLRGVVEYYRTGFDPPDQDWRTAIGYVLSETQPGDAVFFYHPLARLPYEYYRERSHTQVAPRVLFPQRSDARLLKGVPTDPAFLDDAAGRYRRIWLVQNWGPDSFTTHANAVLKQNYRARSHQERGIIRVTLFER